jgi:Na+/phosphate symporter
MAQDSIAVRAAGIQVYKLIDSPEEAVTTVVTEADKGTVAIMSTLTKLEDQITEINDQILAWVAAVTMQPDKQTEDRSYH